MRLLDIITIWAGLDGFLCGPSNSEHQHARLTMREGEGYIYGRLSSSSFLEHHLNHKVVMDKCHFLQVVTFMGGNLSLALCNVNDSRSWIGDTLPRTILELLSYSKPF